MNSGRTWKKQKSTNSKLKSEGVERNVNQENPKEEGKKKAEQERPWANLFATNKLAAKYMILNNNCVLECEELQPSGESKRTKDVFEEK